MRHRARVNDLDFSPDDQRLVTASHDHTAIIWNPRKARQIVETLQHDGPVVRTAFSNDGRVIATATEQGKIHLWDAAIGQPIARPFSVGDPHRPVLLHFTRDGKSLAVMNRRGQSVIRPMLDPPADRPAPKWLPRLAEAVVGERLNEKGIREMVFGAELAEICARLREMKIENEFYAEWRDWFLADRDTRSDFPGQ